MIGLSAILPLFTTLCLSDMVREDVGNDSRKKKGQMAGYKVLEDVGNEGPGTMGRDAGAMTPKEIIVESLD